MDSLALILSLILLTPITYSQEPQTLVREPVTALESLFLRDRGQYQPDLLIKGSFLKSNQPPVTIEPTVLGSLIDNGWNEVGYREITNYTAREEETDSSPCITASGLNICKTNKTICASNEFEFGTILRFGDYRCEVQDRMNIRYTYRVDLLTDNLEEAINFGVKTFKVYKKL